MGTIGRFFTYIFAHLTARIIWKLFTAAMVLVATYYLLQYVMNDIEQNGTIGKAVANIKMIYLFASEKIAEIIKFFE